MTAVAAALVIAVVLHRWSSRPPIRIAAIPLVADPVKESAGAGARRARRWMLLVVAVVFVSVLLDPILVFVVAVVVLVRPRLQRLVAKRAVQRATEAALPDAIELLILVVHAGMTPHQAIDLLALQGPEPTRCGFVEVARRTARGSTLADALPALADELGPGAAIVSDTLAMSERYGTPIGRALEQLADDVRERRRRHAEANARKLPIKLSFPLVACTLPSFVLIAIVPAVLGALSSLGDSGF